MDARELTKLCNIMDNDIQDIKAKISHIEDDIKLLQLNYKDLKVDVQIIIKDIERLKS